MLSAFVYTHTHTWKERSNLLGQSSYTSDGPQVGFKLWIRNVIQVSHLSGGNSVTLTIISCLLWSSLIGSKSEESEPSIQYSDLCWSYCKLYLHSWAMYFNPENMAQGKKTCHINYYHGDTDIPNECQFYSWLFYFKSIYLIMCLEMEQKMAQVLEPLLPK